MHVCTGSGANNLVAGKSQQCMPQSSTETTDILETCFKLYGST